MAQLGLRDPKALRGGRPGGGDPGIEPFVGDWTGTYTDYRPSSLGGITTSGPITVNVSASGFCQIGGYASGTLSPTGDVYNGPTKVFVLHTPTFSDGSYTMFGLDPRRVMPRGSYCFINVHR